MTKHYWTTAEERQLRAWYGQVSAAEIARRIGCTKYAVFWKAHSLGLHAMRVDGWSARRLARLLGVSDSLVGDWLRLGVLKRQHKDAIWHSIADSEVRRFIR